MAAQKKEKEEITFETALSRLETIVQTMESGDKGMILGQRDRVQQADLLHAERKLLDPVLRHGAPPRINSNVLNFDLHRCVSLPRFRQTIS